MPTSTPPPEILLVFACIVTLIALWPRTTSHRSISRRRRIRTNAPHIAGRNAAKPPWVHKEVLRLKALMPDYGCRKIAIVFNHLHRHRRELTVGKTFVATVDRSSKRTVLGLLDHGSRACSTLSNMRSKSSVAILRVILDAIDRSGRPKYIRTDNESVFTSALFRLALRLLGVRHQRTAPFAPWQNGRVEQFFKTFKELARKWPVWLAAEPQEDLDLFRLWYNHIRPHQHLDGLTPAQHWSGKGPARSKEASYFSAWDRLLTGFYFPS